MENVLTLTYDSTHYFLLDCKDGKLLVDAGMPGSLPRFRAQLKARKVELSSIRYVMMTHHHPDHAGILQEIRDVSGAKLLIHAVQVAALAELQKLFVKKGGYTAIRIGTGDLVLQTPNRAVLHNLGVQGEVIETPGHSPDSVSLLMDSGLAFVGDMNPLYLEDAENHAQEVASWNQLLERGARTFYPAHAEPFAAEEIRRRLH